MERLSQDGFSAVVEGASVGNRWAQPGMEQVPPQPTGYIPPKLSELELSENPDGTMTVVRCLNTGAVDLDIVRSAGTDRISAIGPRAFEGMTQLQRVILPEGLRQIGERAFADCKSLTALVIPGGVQRVGTLAFARCRSLQRVRLEPGVRMLGPSCFSKCESLARIDVPSSVTTFGGGVFFGSRNVQICGGAETAAARYAEQYGLAFDTERWRTDETLVLEESEDGTLAVTGLRDGRTEIVEIPKELCGRPITSVAERSFYGLMQLRTVIFRGPLVSIGEKAFFGCPALKDLIFEAAASSIGDSAFAGCSELERIVLPRGTGEIGRLAFFGCSRLGFVKMPPTTRVQDMAFDGCASGMQVYGGVNVGRF